MTIRKVGELPVKILGRSVIQLLGATVASIYLMSSPHSARADLIVDASRYCSAGSNATTTSDTVVGGLLSLSDVSLGVATAPASQSYSASNCYGHFDPGNSNPTNEASALNMIFGTTAGSQELYYLDGTGGAPSPTGLGGITFTVSIAGGGQDGAVGNWTLAWTDSNGVIPQNLPVYVDLAFLLNGGNNNAAYLLSSVLLPISPTLGNGTFDIQFLNRGGQQPSVSHLTVAGRIVAVPTIIEVPEPATTTMFGLGLMSLCLLRRRSRGTPARCHH